MWWRQAATRKKIDLLKKDLRKLSAVSALSIDEAGAYDKIKKEISEEQKLCLHEYELHSLFSSIKTICKHCDMEC